jgi:hypothetical protein
MMGLLPVAAVVVIVALGPGFAYAQASAPSASTVGETAIEQARALAEEAIRKAEAAQAMARDVSRAAEAMKLAEEAKRLAEQAARMVESATPRAASQPVVPETAAAPRAAVAPAPKAPRPESLSFTFNYRVRGWLQGNLDLGKHTGGDNADAFIDHRPRIRMDAGYRPFDLTLLLAKGDSVRDFSKVNPERESSVIEKWGTNTLIPFDVRWAYLQYTGPVVVRAGRQLIELGHNITLQGDMDSLKVDMPFAIPNVGSLSLGAAYSKFPFISGGAGGLDDTDLDAWMGTADFRPFRLVRGIRLRPYFYKVVDYSHPGSQALDLNLDRDGNPDTHPRDGGLEPLWLGLAVDGRHGDFEYWIEGVRLIGSFDRNRHFDAYALVGNASYKVGRYTLQLSAGFGSGAGGRGATNEQGDFKDFLAAFTCKERFKYGVLYGVNINGGFGFFQSNLANITFVRPKLEVELWKDFTVGLSYAYLRATEKVFEGVGPQGFFGTPVSSKRTSDVGHDFGFDVFYRIAKPVTTFMRFGYFLPGDVYRLPGGRSADPAYELMLGTEFNLALKIF